MTIKILSILCILVIGGCSYESRKLSSGDTNAHEEVNPELDELQKKNNELARICDVKRDTIQKGYNKAKNNLSLIKKNHVLKDEIDCNIILNLYYQAMNTQPKIDDRTILDTIKITNETSIYHAGTVVEMFKITKILNNNNLNPLNEIYTYRTNISKWPGLIWGGFSIACLGFGITYLLGSCSIISEFPLYFGLTQFNQFLIGYILLAIGLFVGLILSYKTWHRRRFNIEDARTFVHFGVFFGLSLLIGFGSLAAGFTLLARNSLDYINSILFLVGLIFILITNFYVLFIDSASPFNLERRNDYEEILYRNQFFFTLFNGISLLLVIASIILLPICNYGVSFDNSFIIFIVTGAMLFITTLYSLWLVYDIKKKDFKAEMIYRKLDQ